MRKQTRLPNHTNVYGSSAHPVASQLQHEEDAFAHSFVGVDWPSTF